MADQFEGEHGAELPGLSLIRSESMEVRNDMRFFAGNVIHKRLGAFHLIAVSALFIGVYSAKKMMELETDDPEVYKTPTGKIMYAALVAMAGSFILCLTAGIIILVQLYHITRLITFGPTGFEMAKSYYLNPNVTTMRHFAVRCFFACIPLYMIASGISIYLKLGEEKGLYRSLPLAIMLFVAAIVIFCIIAKLRSTFTKSYSGAMTSMEPLLKHLADTDRRENHQQIMG